MTSLAPRKPYRAMRIVEITVDGETLALEADLEFTIEPYVPERGPSYASGGEPASGGGIEDIRCTAVRPIGDAAIGRIECPKWLADWIAAHVDEIALCNEAAEDDAAEAENVAVARSYGWRDD